MKLSNNRLFAIRKVIYHASFGIRHRTAVFDYSVILLDLRLATNDARRIEYRLKPDIFKEAHLKVFVTNYAQHYVS